MNGEASYLISHTFELILVVAAAVLSLLMTGLFYYVRRGHAVSDKQWSAIEGIQKSQGEQSILLARIEVRLDHYDDLKKKQEHDHRDLRNLDKLVEDLRHRVANLEDGQKDLSKFCRTVHGDRVSVKE